MSFPVDVSSANTGLGGIPLPVLNRGSEFSAKDVGESEKLRLQAIEIADRLPATSHLRRKAHRDLSLWYSTLGKTELAEKQKKILFQLVGFEDDRLLYPQNINCNQTVWWERQNPPNQHYCGMG